MTARSRYTAALAAAVALASGCAEADPAADAFAVRDSAGVRIAESTGAAWTEDVAWRLSAEPVLTLGVAEGAGAQQFGRPVALLLRPDGGVLVADRDAAEIRDFDAAGAHQRTLGGRGSGPGEFTALNDLFLLPGDTLVAADFMGRLTLFTKDGQVARTVDLGQPPPTGRLPDGRWFRSVSLSPEGGVQLGAQRYGNALLAVAEESGDADTLAVQPGMDAVHVEMNFDGRVQVVGQPFPYGRYRLTELHEGTVWTTDGSAFEVAQLAADGSLRALVRRPGERPPVTGELRERYAADLLAAAPERALPAVRRRLERVVFPDTVPAWQGLLVDAEGNAWARRYELPDDSLHTWTVFSPEGRWLGDVATPADLEVMAIGHGRLAGVWRDGMGVPYVRVYRIDNHPDAG